MKNTLNRNLFKFERSSNEGRGQALAFFIFPKIHTQEISWSRQNRYFIHSKM